MNNKELILLEIDKKIRSFNLREIENYEKHSGPGFLKKIKRLILAPSIVLRLKLLNFSKKFLNKYNKIEFQSNFELLLYFIRNLESLNELKTFKFLVKNLNENDIFYDIGAEVGLYTALGLELAKEVHAFEPIPLNQLALADYIGTANFCLGPTTIVEDVKNLYPDKSKEITVQTITLDEYLKKYNKPTFIKMDVEGAEHLIIKGGYNFLKENNPILIVEILGDEFLENSMKTVNILKELGFRAYKINFDGDLEFFDYEKFKHSQGVCNYVFKK